MAWNANVPAHDFHEIRIAFCGPDVGHVADEPEKKAGNPQAQPKTECSRYRVATARGAPPSGSVR